ncbi:hypothetical protein M1558_02725 [Candidatus Parvarchaeota archaeon]|nr:hypothetical protein [Candidatus Parvarchaeota archaeon]
MVLYEDFHFYWVIFEVINGFIISILSIANISVLYKHRQDKTPLVRWALNEKDSKKNFSVLLFASVLFVVVFAVYSFGSFMSNYFVKMAAELLGTFTYLLVSYVIIGWSKSFWGVYGKRTL